MDIGVDEPYFGRSQVLFCHQKIENHFPSLFILRRSAGSHQNGFVQRSTFNRDVQ